MKRIIITLVVVLCGVAALASAMNFAQKKVIATVPPPTEGPIISINFDDGYASAYDVAIPILESAGFKATVYIITSNINQEGRMSAEQIRSLESAGHEIGAHSRHHVLLSTLAKNIQIRREVLGSRQDLLNIGVRHVDTFSYPEGDIGNNERNIVSQNGFSAARTAVPSFNSMLTDPYLLNSLRVPSDSAFPDVKNAIDELEKNKQWLILDFHSISDKNADSVSEKIFKDIVNYIKEKNIPVVTTRDGLKIMKNIK